MSTVPTIRVVNSALPSGFMIINQSDLKEHHEVYANQAVDFKEVVVFEEEHTIIVRAFNALMARQLELTPEEWAAKPTAERMTALVKAEQELNQSIANNPIRKGGMFRGEGLDDDNGGDNDTGQQPPQGQDASLQPPVTVTPKPAKPAGWKGPKP